MKILLVGGGSGGPVTPILAVALEIKNLKPKTEFLFVGTKKGPESSMVAELGIKFVHIPAAKWRRYISVKNIFEPFIFIFGFFRALYIIKKFQPDIVFGAGSFVSVPVAWAARLKKVKIVIHQQDARVGLANRLIAPFADQITTAFEKTSKEFYSGWSLKPENLKAAASWVGNPVRPDFLHSKVDARQYFHLTDDLPVLLVLGGATGAVQINTLLQNLLPELVKSFQVVHQTGRGKNTITFKDPNYHPYELISFPEYSAVFKLAHLVISRAGLSTIAELSALGKPAIVIPMPKTHQEENAKILLYTHSAAVLMGQVTPEILKAVINKLKFDPEQAEILSQNIRKLMPQDSSMQLAKIIIQLINEK